MWTTIPGPLKLHPSTLHYLGLLDHHPQKAELLRTSTLKKPFQSAIDLSKTQIILTSVFRSKTGGDISDQGFQNLIHRTQRRLKRLELLSESSMLDHVESLYGTRNHIWSFAESHLHNSVKSKFSFEESDQFCSVSSLELSSDKQNIIISGLHELYGGSIQPSTCFAVVLAVLASDHEVTDVRLRHEKSSFNNYIKSIIQSEVYGEGFNMYPYLQVGLNGTSQVVGVGDTGLDELSCFFNEGDNSLVNRSQYTNPITNITRRKVVQYVAYKDGADTAGGHGTQ